MIFYEASPALEGAPFSLCSGDGDVSYLVQTWESTRCKVMCTRLGIGVLWKETDYATQARDHGGGERLPRLLPG